MTATCSQPIHQVYLDGMIEIIGPGGTADALKQAGLSEWMQAGEPAVPCGGLTTEAFGVLQLALEHVYGELGGRGLAQRIGRAVCRALLRDFGEELGLTTLEQRLLPTQERIRSGLRMLAQAVAADDHAAGVEETADAYLWRVEQCADCSGREPAAHALCYFTTGLLQEFMEISGGGKVYVVSETECAACGDPACVFRIPKKPLD